jgi:L-galactose dehydrogenase
MSLSMPCVNVPAGVLTLLSKDSCSYTGCDSDRSKRLEKVVLGKTGLMVSPAGLGCGGYSRLGMRQSKDPVPAEAVVKHALDLGINFFDTARAYGTEEVVGRMVSGCRDDVVISTKTMFRQRDGSYMLAGDLVDSLDKSLERLRTDRVEIFSLHGVTPDHLDYCLNEFVPMLQQQVALGKIRHLGITESFMQDPVHEMLAAAIPTGVFDVVMVGFNFLNSGARDTVFPLALENGVGTQVMHAVRRALSNEDVLIETVTKLIESGELEEQAVNQQDPLQFVKAHEEVGSIVEAAYRYCRHEPGVSVVLTGTGSTAHLSGNVEALTKPPLPDALAAEIDRIFGRVRSISGD